MEEPSVYCVIPVHNRRDVTIECVRQLRAQTFFSLYVVVVDDGSTDGTSEALQALNQDKLHVIRGDGSLWWGGAMELGLDYVNSVASDSDYILMFNDDVQIAPNFVGDLVAELSSLGPMHILGAKQVELSTGRALARGYKIDFWRIECEPLQYDSEILPDALPARGLLVPVSVNMMVGGVNSFLFPHAFSDLEYSCRAKEKGVTLKISESCMVLTELDDDNEQASPRSLIDRIFSAKAKNNVRDQLLFFCVRGPWYHRFTAPLRFGVFKTMKLISKANSTI